MTENSVPARVHALKLKGFKEHGDSVFGATRKTETSQENIQDWLQLREGDLVFQT
jgi:tRNA 2-selenouridine synthase SelU